MKRKLIPLILVVAFVVAMTSGVSAAVPGASPMAQQQYQLEFDDIQSFIVRNVAGMESTAQVLSMKTGPNAKGGGKSPAAVSFSNLIVSRPFVQNSELLKWNDSIIKGADDRKDGCLTVIDHLGKPVLKYIIHDAWPCRYTIRIENYMLIEEMELVIGSAEFESSKSN